MSRNDFKVPYVSILKKFISTLLYYLNPCIIFFEKLFVITVLFQLEWSCKGDTMLLSYKPNNYNLSESLFSGNHRIAEYHRLTYSNFFSLLMGTNKYV